MDCSKVAIIITAAGSSTRIGSGVKKEYLPYKNGTVLSNCAIAFLKAEDEHYICNEDSCDERVVNAGFKFQISDFVITCPEGGEESSRKALFSDKDFTKLLEKKITNKNPDNFNVQFVAGGSSRQKSVFNALEAVKNSGTNPDLVLIHDGARPFVTEKIILDVIECAAKYGASVPGVTPIDTQKEIDENGFILRHLVRKNLCAVQTPQGFLFQRLYEGHKKAAKEDFEFTDDTEIWGRFCGEVKTVSGDVNNIKITYPSDLERL